VDDDTAWRRVKAFDQVAAARPGFLSVAECQRLINAAEVHAALLTGCRYGELCRLECRDFVRGKLHIRESKTSRPRWIVLTDEGRHFTILTVGRAGDEVMLTRDGLPWLKSNQSEPMRRACIRAGTVPVLGFHQLRHSYASLCVMADLPLMVLARNLGHTSTKMVERFYGHLRDDYVDEAIQAGAPRFGLMPQTNVRALNR
jgi:integrase